MDKKKIIDAFWRAVPEKTTWEDLNRGMTIFFSYGGRFYSINTRLGNFWSMNIEQYTQLLYKRCFDAVDTKRKEL